MIGRWLDPRAIVLAAILAVAAALPSMTTSVERRDYYLFDLKLTSSQAGTTQVFWDLGRGFNEYDSSRQPLKIEKDPVVYRYMLPMGKFKGLRLDPIDGSGEFIFWEAQIVDYKNRVIRKFTPEDFEPFREIEHMEGRGDALYVRAAADASDPILMLKLREPLELETNAYIWFQLGWPVAWKVFLAGLLLSLTPISQRIGSVVAGIAARAKANPVATIAIAATIAVAVQCHPVIFLGRSFASPNNGGLMLYGTLPTLPGNEEYMYANSMGSDTGALLFNHLYYPMVAREALSHGELPLWNRYSLTGMPLLGQGQSMFGEPLNFIPTLANGAAWAWDVRFVLARWIFAASLAFAVWMLTRHLAASLLVAIGSVFIGYFTYRINHPANFSACYAPMILWAWAGLIHAGTSRRQAVWLGALVLANWMVMTSGTVKEAYMAMVCLNLAGTILLFSVPAAAGRRLKVLALGIAAGAVFTLLSAPLWISFLVSLKHSWTVYDEPTVQSLPVTNVIGFFDDMFYRQTSLHEAVVAPALNFLFLLGVVWWFVNPRLWRTDRAGAALVGGALIPFAMAFSIIPAAWIVKMPFIGNIHHIGNTFSCPLVAVMIILAGCGFRDAIERMTDPNLHWKILRVVAGVALLAVVFHFSTRGFPRSQFFKGYAPALMVAAASIALGYFWAARSSRVAPLLVALAVGLPLLLWRHSQHMSSEFNQYAFVPGIRADLHAPSAGVKYIDSIAKEPGRRTGWGNTLFPVYNVALNWEGLYGVDTLRNRHYHELAKEFNMERVWIWDAENRAEDANRLLPIHDLLNNDYYVADHISPPREFPGVELLKELDLDVYRSRTAWPRAFFTDRLTSYTTLPEFASLVANGDRRPFAAAQRSDADIPSLPEDLAERRIEPAREYRLTGNTTSFVIEAPGPGIAVLTEAYYEHDFRATVNDKPAKYFRVNHAFRGIEIPAAGRYEITFAYWPLYTTESLWLAAAGLAFALLGGGMLWMRKVAVELPSS